MNVPTVEYRVGQLIGTRQVLELTGLTADQLREWTVRRNLIAPDIPAQKRGSGARFGWRTVLLLRLAVVLRQRFHVELQAHSDLFGHARALLGDLSFPALWGMTLVIYDLERCALLDDGVSLADEDALLLRLDRHLEALSRGFGMIEPLVQLPLFPLRAVAGEDRVEGSFRVGRERSA